MIYNSNRKLASIQEIKSLKKHPNADKLEIAEILGWNIVVPLNLYKEKEKVIYVEYDSLIPIKNENYPDFIKKEKLYHVKTQKIRGIISQGLILPLNLNEKFKNLEIGTDLTSDLSIIKKNFENINNDINIIYNKPFPINLIEKTNENRIQSHTYLLENLKDKDYYITEKLDGTSATYLLDPFTDKLIICSRNLIINRIDKLSLKSSSNVYVNMALKYNMFDKLTEYVKENNKYIAFQGELCGPNINKNKLNLKENDLYVFNILTLNNNFFHKNNLDEMKKLANIFNLKTVPIMEEGVFKYNTIDELINLSKGNYKTSNMPREGIVVRSNDQSISFKVINNDYLLKNKQ